MNSRHGSLVLVLTVMSVMSYEDENLKQDQLTKMLFLLR